MAKKTADNNKKPFAAQVREAIKSLDATTKAIRKSEFKIADFQSPLDNPAERIKREYITEKAKFENPEYTGTNTDSTIKFTVDGTEVVLNVRGWGFLTGYKKLPNNTAAEIQDEFGKFVIECIKAATEPSDKE